MVVKTYRGLLTSGGQDRIRLQTIKGKVGYRIVKFEVLPEKFGAAGVYYEAVTQIWKTLQTTINAEIDFTDSDLLASSIFGADTAATGGYAPVITIFDTEVFNQDIYVTNSDLQANAAMNYYLELEVIPLNDAGAEYTTLKDMRQT